MKLIFKTCLYIFIFICNIQKLYADELESDYGQLVFVSTVFRHGDRTPGFYYKDDAYDESYWTQGSSQLTNKGKRQMYEMGKWFRETYDELLGEKYHADTIYVMSSDKDRAIMSAECFLAAVYPPSDSEIWTTDLTDWQPIPVHSIPSALDSFLAGTADCEKIQNQKYVINEIPAFRKYYDVHKDVLQLVLSYSGISVEEGDVYESLSIAALVSDTLTVEESNNLTLPSWAIPIYPQPLHEIELLNQEACWYTKIQKRLQIGPLLDMMIRNMTDKINERMESNKTVAVYSAHEHAMVGLRKVLQLYHLHKPPYASNMMFELRRKENDFYVLVRYKNDTGDAFILDLPKCPNPCHFDTFVKSLKEFIPDNWPMECSNLNRQLEDSSSISAVPAIILLICVFVIIWICFRCLKKKKKKNYVKFENI